MKKLISYSIIILTILLITSCSIEKSSYKVYENIAGTYGVEVESAKHNQDIEISHEYKSKNAVETKQTKVFDKTYNLEYKKSEKSIYCYGDIDYYEYQRDENSEIIKTGYISGTDQLCYYFNSNKKSKDKIVLTKEERINILYEFASKNFDISLYERSELYTGEEIGYENEIYFYSLSYYNEYDGFKLGDSLSLDIDKYGDVYLVRNYYNDCKNKFEQMDLKINSVECNAEIVKKLDKIYGEGKYEFEISNQVLCMSPDDKPFIDYWLKVNAEGAFNAELCNLLLFIEK